ncbi:MAG TPA: hypothetical protein PKE15_00685 [Ottowia sp.]|nr:hypothetical protein [Ottowia sp.]
MIQYVIPALIGLVAGLIGSLIAPWVHWGIEKRRTLLESRRSLITSARIEMSAPVPPRERFREKPIYSRIRPHLSEETIKIIESDTIFIQQGGRGDGANNYSARVLDDILELEKKWKLL